MAGGGGGGEAVVRKGFGAAAVNVARHLVEQDRPGERGVGVGQKGLGRLRTQRFATVGREIAHRLVAIGTAAIPIGHAATVEPEKHGSTACQEQVLQYVELLVVGETIKKKKRHQKK